MGKQKTIEKKPQPAIQVKPKLKEPFPRAVTDNTFVYRPQRSLVATGGMKLQLKSGPPEFKGYIIFINGFWGDPVKNTGAVAWNSLMDKVPERGDSYSLRGAENTNEKDLTDDDDRYTPEEYKKDTANPVKTQIKESIKDGLFPGRAIYMLFHATKFERYVKYWNVKENKYQFTAKYAEYFDAKDNIHYFNGSHGLQSDPGHRMQHGYKQGLTWAKLNLKYMEKPSYDTFRPYMPGLASPEYNPITIVMHSQGNALGVGVAKGILAHLQTLKWDKAAINMVYLALHQNKGFTIDEYNDYKKKKLDMLANKHMKAKLAEFFERNKLYIAKGIDEYAGERIVGWNKLKSRGVQFTFSNDRSDVVSRLGDIQGIANACNSDGDDMHFTPFEVTPSSYRIFSKHILNKILTYDDEGTGVNVAVKEKKTVIYTDLVADFSKVYHAYKAKQADIEAGRDKAFYTYTSTGSTMGIAVTSTVYTIRPYEDAVVTAYTKLFDAELAAHSGPVAWGLDTRVLDWAPGKSVFDMIREKGAGVFYRKANKNAKLLIDPAQIH